jgi:drug/metabolite transporter (DMT)-like permease
VERADGVRRREAVGLSLATASSATFGTSGTFAASLLAVGWTPGAAVTARIVIAAVVLTVPALLVLRRHRVDVRRGGRTLATYGLVAVAGAQLCYFNAVNHLSVAVALLLEYGGILLVVGWMWLRHGQRPRWLTGTGAAIALAGLVLVLDLAGNHHVDGVGALWGLGAAVGLATYFVLSANDTDAPPPLVVAWGGLVVGGAVLLVADLSGALPHAAPRVDVTLVHTRMSWLVPVLGLSLVAAVVAYVTGIAGVRLLGARLASFVGLLEVLFAVLFAWLALGQSLSATQLTGGVLIVAGIALVRVDELRSGDGESAVIGDPELAALERAAI